MGVRDELPRLRQGPHQPLQRRVPQRRWQCVCRGIARSSLASNAVKTHDAEPLKAALAKAIPHVPADSALAAVREWWKVDHMDIRPT